MSKKIPPSRMLLGCVLAHPPWFADVADAFNAKDFSADVDKKLWQAFAELHEQGKQASPMDALGAVADLQGADKAIGQLTKLMRLCESETRESFARRVSKFATKAGNARAKKALARMSAAADEDGEVSWAERFDAAAVHLRKMDRRKTHYTPLTFERFSEVASDKRRKVVIPTGFAAIDKRIGGFIVGHTTAICARTNVGKSSVLAALAQNQFYAHAARNPGRKQGSANPWVKRLEPAHARHPKNEKVGERAPYVLILSVEDEVDAYLSRFVCDLCDVAGHDFLLDPAQSIYGEGLGERFESVARTFTTDGRLTIADYEFEEGQDEKSIDAIEKTIVGWKRNVEAACLERGEELPPMLVLLDYFQKIEITDEESKTTPERMLLRKISSRLARLAKRQHFAFVPAVMLLRAPDEVEPDHNGARGGSDVVQDADVVLTLWPFGPGERAALRAQIDDGEVPDNVRPIKPQLVGDSFEEMLTREDPDAEDLSEFETYGDTPQQTELDVPTMRRVINELVVMGNKNRHGAAGWEVALEFDREHKRLTDAYTSTIYRRDPDILAVLKEARKRSGKDVKR